MNKVILFGNVGKDPEMRSTSGGTSVLKFSVATSERRQDKSGDWQEFTEWHNVVVWGKRAEGLQTFLAKGMSVLVEGKLRTSSWEDKDTGKKVYRTEVNADDVKVTTKKSEQRDEDRGGAKSPKPATRPTERKQDFPDDDIPF